MHLDKPAIVIVAVCNGCRPAALLIVRQDLFGQLAFGVVRFVRDDATRFKRVSRAKRRRIGISAYFSAEGIVVDARKGLAIVYDTDRIECMFRFIVMTMINPIEHTVPP